MTRDLEAIAIGIRRHRAGDLAEAAAAYVRALLEHPDDPDVQCLLGSARLAMGAHSQAATDLRAAIAARPGYPEAHNNLGVALTGLGELDEAEAVLHEAIRLRPGYAEAHNNLGDVVSRMGRPQEAEACFRAALTIRPDYAEALMNLGVLICDRGQIEEAVALYESSLQLRPKSAACHVNLGNAFRDLGRCGDAEDQYRVALDLDRDLPEAHYNRGLNRLMMGDFEQGWRDHEWRLKCRAFARNSRDRPTWDGSPLEGRSVLIHAEQGLGDTIQFVRYAALAKQRGGRVVFECPSALRDVLARTPGIDLLVARGEPLPDYDVQAPLMSLPMILGTSRDSIPSTVPYVFADPVREAYWRGPILASKQFKIGVCWQGNPKYAADVQRLFPLEAMVPIARLPQVRLVSLQKGHGTEQIAALGGLFEIEVLGPGFEEGAAAFVDAAAAIRSLDLIIAPDTALAHLAGAMGAPVWVALPASVGWRWMLGRDDSPWYPSMRLFRRATTGAWTDVFEAMSRRLADRLEPMSGTLLVQVSPGELIDRIAILEIKSRKIADATKLSRVRYQLDALATARDREIGSPPGLKDLAGELDAVNESIWECEEGLRAFETSADFGPGFIALARRVYRDNDRRAALKQEIDGLLGSTAFEVKSYRDFR